MLTTALVKKHKNIVKELNGSAFFFFLLFVCLFFFCVGGLCVCLFVFSFLFGCLPEHR